MRLFKTLFSPPIFPDEEETRVARLLNIILWAVVLVITFYTIPTYIINRDLLAYPNLQDVSFALSLSEVSNLMVVGCCLILLRLMRFGQVKIISGIFVLFSWMSFTYQAVFAGGVHDAAYTTYYLLVILAAVLVGPWFAVWFTLPLIMAGYFLAYAEVNGIIEGNVDGPYSIWFDHSVILVLMAIFIFLMSNSLKQNLQKARQSTAQLTQAYQKLQQANQAKSEFITMMSHELRTPLNAINGFAELMVLGISGELPESVRTDAQHIYQNGQHLATLVDDILNMVQTEVKDVQLSLQPISVDAMIKNVFGELKVHFYKKSLSFDCSIATDAEFVQADPIRLKQILYNLTQNALKFTTKGGVFIDVQRHDKNTVRFSVRDTGVGIPKLKQAHLFEPFQHFDLSNTEPDNIGIGLLICQELVQLHQGEIWLESEEQQGTTVHFTMPVAALERACNDTLSQEII